jgi:glutamyl-tRNA synthetase
LHLGHARTFLVTWWLARQAQAEVIMRMEDLDAGRAKPESVAQAYEDLRWLGMDWDRGPGANDQSGMGSLVQSERAAAGVYADVIEKLWQANKVFPCTCTRADLHAAVGAGASAPHEGEGQPRYPGTCRIPMEANPCVQVMPLPGQTVTTWRPPSAAVAQWKSAAGKPVCWRFQVDPGITRFDDAILGPQAFDVSAEIGDFPITRFDGTPAYQLAVVTDDAAMGIDCVIRGDDLLSSTPRQILIYEALGAPVPIFAHVPLVVGTDGKRLAKRHGESRIAQFREQGVKPERVVGWAAWRSGQIEKPEEMATKEMVGRFDLAKLPRERVVMTGEDLAWLVD